MQLMAEYSLDLINWSPVDIIGIAPGSAGVDTVTAPLVSEDVRGYFRARVVGK